MAQPNRFRTDSQWFGIRVDGLDTGIKFPTLSDADGSVQALVAQGHRAVAIFDRRTGKEIEQPIRNSALN